MSTSPERLPSQRTSQPASHERKLGIPGLFGKKETDWGTSLYNFGYRSGLEELRQMTDSTIRNDTQYMIRIVEERATNIQQISLETHTDRGRKYRRITFQDNLEGVSRATKIGEDIDVTAISFYKDYELNKKGRMITPSISSQCGLNFELIVGEQPTSYLIGHRSDNTGFVKTNPEGFIYHDIFPIPGSHIPNRLAELYPEQSPTAKADMVRDMSFGSGLELELTLGASKIIEQIYGMSLLEIRTATMIDVFMHVVDETPDIKIILKQWSDNLLQAEEGNI